MKKKAVLKKDGAVKEPLGLYSAFPRITFDRNVMAGQACLRGMRVPVSLVVNLVANGMSTNDILKAYPYLEKEDISQSLKYAAWLTQDRVLIPAR